MGRFICFALAFCSLAWGHDPAASRTARKSVTPQMIRDFFGPDLDNTSIRGIRSLLNLDESDALSAGDIMEERLFELLYCTWSPKDREAFLKLKTEKEKLEKISEYYDLISWDRLRGMPIGLSPNKNGNLTVNCLLCHMAKRDGVPVLGAPNTQNITLLYEDIDRLRKLGAANAKDQKANPKNAPMDACASFTSTPPNGVISEMIKKIHGPGKSTNAFVYSFILAHNRSPRDFSMLPNWQAGLAMTAAMGTALQYPTGDRPIPWWRAAQNKKLGMPAYHTGPAIIGEKDTDLNFLHFTTNFPDAKFPFDEKTKQAIGDVVHLIQEVKAPRATVAVAAEILARGRRTYEQSCSLCHGTYDENGNLKGRIPRQLWNVGTDPNLSHITQRFAAVMRRNPKFAETFTDQGDGVYAGPNLEGIAASGPYFHNGSVPTLRGVLIPNERPTYFTTGIAMSLKDGRADAGYEFQVRTPEEAASNVKRDVYDTTKPGYRNVGHPYLVSPSEVDALIHYLRSL